MCFVLWSLATLSDISSLSYVLITSDADRMWSFLLLPKIVLFLLLSDVLFKVLPSVRGLSGMIH